MCDQMTFEGFDTATGSPASADGRLHCTSPDGPMTVKFGPEARLVRTTALREPCLASAPGSKAPEADLYDRGWLSSQQGALAASISRTCRGSSRRLPRSRAVWRALATVWPDPNERLAILLRLISAGECGLLPTVTARDSKNPGRPDHARLSATRGEALPETFGLPLPTALSAWMMGFPPEWLQSAPLATPSTHGSRPK